MKKLLLVDKKGKKELDLFLKETAAMVNPVIKELLELHVDKKFHRIVDYQASTGGKRLRPTLTIICSKLLGGKTKDILYPAAGLEILHNCTLIVDDIIDHARLRRKRLTTLFKFGQSVADCMGLDYLATAFEGANRSKKPVETSKIFVSTLKTLVNGEILDVLFEQSGREDEPYIIKNRYHKITAKEYYMMIERKTAALFQGCCEVGGINVGASKKQVKALRDYGFNLGMIFQITDDILDIFGNEKKFGKKIGKDIQERKLGNIIILSALKELPMADKNKLLRIIRKKEIKNKDIKEAAELIKKTKSYKNAYCLLENFVKTAKQSLKDLPQNKWNKALENLVDFVVQREK